MITVVDTKGQKASRERQREGYTTSYLPTGRLNEIMMDKRTSCLAYLIRKGWVEKLLSVSSILHTPYTSSEPRSGTTAQKSFTTS